MVFYLNSNLYVILNKNTFAINLNNLSSFEAIDRYLN